MSTFKDLRQALRSLARSPGLAIAVILTLAIAMGATLMMFTFIDAILLKPLPFDEPDRLVAVWDSNPGQNLDKFRPSPFNFLHWQERAEAFSSLALYDYGPYIIVGGDEPIQLYGSMVSEGFFSLLGVEPIHGRGFSSDDYEASAGKVVILSHALWSEQFGADPGAVGQEIRLNEEPYTVIGVMPRQILPQVATPAGKVELSSRDRYLWVPMSHVPATDHSHAYGVLGRLRSGVSLEAARTQMEAIASALAEEFPKTNQGYTVRLVPLEEEAVGEIETSFWILFGSVFLLLVIACVNVTHLLLVRAASRVRDLAVRTALGADLTAMLRMFFFESLALVVPAAALGTLLASWGRRLFIELSPGDIPRLQEALLGPRAMAVLGGLVVFAVVVFTLVPGVQVRWRKLQAALTEGGRGGLGRGGMLFRRLLVGVEMALAVVLVIGSGLLVRSYERLRAVDPGFDAQSALVVELMHHPARYGKRHDLTGFYDRLLTELEGIPGVSAVTAAYDHPLTSSWFQGFAIEDAPRLEPGERPGGLFRTVTPGYFEALGARIAAGRSFTQGDDAAGAGVVIINQALARRYFYDRDPLGARLKISSPRWMWGEEVPDTYEIVGVVEDIKSTGLDSEAEPAFYLSYSQAPQHRTFTMLLTERDPATFLPEVRQRLRVLDPQLPIGSVSSLQEIFAELTAKPRLNAVVLGSFAAMSFLLAILGLWGMVRSTTQQRTQEMGIRSALGADRRKLLLLVIGQGLVPVLAGAVAGILGALAFNRVLAGLLFGVSATDPVTYVLVPLVLLIVAAAACFLPAWKASGIDPMRVLRVE